MTKMGTKNTPLDTSRESRAYYEEHWPLGGVYVIPPNEAPPFLFSSGLLAKTDRIVVAASGVSGGPADYMLDLLRVHEKEHALKQHPVIVRFFPDGSPAPSGCLPQHADFPGRNISLSGEWAAFKANRSGGFYPVSGFPTATSGLIANLTSPPLEEAYRFGIALRSGFISG